MLIQEQKTVCKVNNCTGCMACVDICPKNAIKIVDELNTYNAVVDTNKCVDCDSCERVCQQNHSLNAQSPISWYQGWAKDEEIRKNASSGGFATAISNAFIENGGVVCSCVFNHGKFIFEFAESVEETKKFAGSKYVKSNPNGIYGEIKKKLIDGQKVLFVGLPCQVAAVKKFIGESFSERLYTIDLICHGTPSPKMLELFLKQYNISLQLLSDMQFRNKTKMQIYGDGKGIITNGVSDKYTIAFLNSLTYTENCYYCQYAKLGRVGDITLGDSWGNDKSVDIQKQGVSLILCQTQKGIEIVEQANLYLENVDIENAIFNNHQLEHPSIMPSRRSEFFDGIKKGEKFNKLIFKLFPKECLRQDIKEILINTKII